MWFILWVDRINPVTSDTLTFPVSSSVGASFAWNRRSRHKSANWCVKCLPHKLLFECIDQGKNRITLFCNTNVVRQFALSENDSPNVQENTCGSLLSRGLCHKCTFCKYMYSPPSVFGTGKIGFRLACKKNKRKHHSTLE